MFSHWFPLDFSVFSQHFFSLFVQNFFSSSFLLCRLQYESGARTLSFLSFSLIFFCSFFLSNIVAPKCFQLKKDEKRTIFFVLFHCWRLRIGLFHDEAFFFPFFWFRSFFLLFFLDFCILFSSFFFFSLLFSLILSLSFSLSQLFKLLSAYFCHFSRPFFSYWASFYIPHKLCLIFIFYLLLKRHYFLRLLGFELFSFPLFFHSSFSFLCQSFFFCWIYSWEANTSRFSIFLACQRKKEKKFRLGFLEVFKTWEERVNAQQFCFLSFIKEWEEVLK